MNWWMTIPFYPLVMTNSSPWKITMLLRTVNHLFRLGPSIPWQTVSHNQRVWETQACLHHGAPLTSMGFSSHIPWLFAQIEDHGLGRRLNQELQPAFQEQVLRGEPCPPEKISKSGGWISTRRTGKYRMSWCKNSPEQQTWGLISDQRKNGVLVQTCGLIPSAAAAYFNCPPCFPNLFGSPVWLVV